MNEATIRKWYEVFKNNKELVEILSGKKGTVRALFGGRYNFTARDVIVPNIKME